MKIRIVGYFAENAPLFADLMGDYPEFEFATGTDLPDRAEITVSTPDVRTHYVNALFSYGAHTVNITKEV